jgi:high-affinity iron transporter
MKFIFNSMARAAAALLVSALVACGGTPPSPPSADGGDAQRVVALLDYIGGDYAMAVRDGVVLSEAEYQEQVTFAADARRLAAGVLSRTGLADDGLGRALAEVEARVTAKASPEDVASACRAAREQVLARFGLATMPTERPSLPRAEALFTEACAACHGSRGDARTERAAQLDPRPAAFTDPERLRDLSPYRVYNALTFGVPGTAMASFAALSPADRWSLAFYVFRLGHAQGRARGPVAMSLGDLASRSDAEVLAALRSEAHPDASAGLAWARRESAFREAPAGVGIDRTRRLLGEGLRAYRDGRGAEADRLVLDAYLQGFEPLEPRLRARDPQGTAAVEESFRDLRAAMSGNDPAAVEARVATLQERLRGMDGARRAVMPAVAAFVIYFREGIEAALLVGALLAGLRRLKREDAARWVHAGWLLALPAGLLTWWLSTRVVALGAQRRELVEAVVSLLAALVLFSVSFWLISKVESQRWLAYLRRQVEVSLGRRNLMLLAGLAFLAVYREAAETVLFTQALLFEAKGEARQVWLGAAVGLLAVAATALLLGRAIGRLPLRPFFAVSGGLLCVLAIAFAGSGIYALVAAGYLSPRPVAIPAVPWLGIHPDLSGLVVQLTIATVVAVAGMWSLRRPSAAASQARR